METEELLAIIVNGEDSRHQFKRNITRAESLVPELAAFSNSKGGLLFIGITDDGGIQGLTLEDMGRINQLVSNAAKDVKPPISVTTENVALPSGMVMVVDVPEGISKPYMDGNLHVWVKNSANKSKVSAREELLRMFQEAALIHADEIHVAGSSVVDIDQEFFDAFFEREYSERVEDQEVSRVQLLENMNLSKNGQLNICGALLFASRPQIRLPVFIVKAVAFPGVDIEDEHYIDSQDINGKLSDVFQKVLGFVLANIRHVQNEQSINSVGEQEIPRIVLEELIANALIHRDYFVSAPIKVLVFADRIEIVSPGHLPNNLTIENIKMGNSNVRNPILASFAPKVLPYRGLGSGIKRAIKAYPDIEFVDDRAGNAFKAIIKRAR
ncbi:MULTISPECIES: RNA-binding domain-containing protein [Providencia]|uniref:RNA-binding domain-containing protein n=1 Tax=Providencia TaxID=586 RepID=UPI001121A4ED|nr:MULTISPECIES: RNA-binding domain-containing protein [Providencia]MDW7590851.1 putative DNA binding domain-containing protein [Providencia sp. 2023EL-00965]